VTGEPERLDAPNQQVVRPDGSGPADEGTGGGKPAAKPKEQAKDDKRHEEEAPQPDDVRHRRRAG
jgi:hypothetical protein